MSTPSLKVWLAPADKALSIVRPRKGDPSRQIYSANGQCVLDFSPGGVLSILKKIPETASRKAHWKPMWSSGQGGEALVFKEDGNLELQGAGKKVLWETHTTGVPSKTGFRKLMLSNAGELILCDTNAMGTANEPPVWWSQAEDFRGRGILGKNTDCWLSLADKKVSIIPPAKGEPSLQLFSANGQCVLDFSSGGVLSILKKIPATAAGAAHWKPMWSSGQGGEALVFKENGNLELQGPGKKVLWETQTTGVLSKTGFRKLMITNEGELEVCDTNKIGELNGDILWSSSPAFFLKRTNCALLGNALPPRGHVPVTRCYTPSSLSGTSDKKMASEITESKVYSKASSGHLTGYSFPNVPLCHTYDPAHEKFPMVLKLSHQSMQNRLPKALQQWLAKNFKEAIEYFMVAQTFQEDTIQADMKAADERSNYLRMRPQYAAYPHAPQKAEAPLECQVDSYIYDIKKDKERAISGKKDTISIHAHVGIMICSPPNLQIQPTQFSKADDHAFISITRVPARKYADGTILPPKVSVTMHHLLNTASFQALDKVIREQAAKNPNIDLYAFLRALTEKPLLKPLCESALYFTTPYKGKEIDNFYKVLSAGPPLLASEGMTPAQLTKGINFFDEILNSEEQLTYEDVFKIKDPLIVPRHPGKGNTRTHVYTSESIEALLKSFPKEGGFICPATTLTVKREHLQPLADFMLPFLAVADAEIEAYPKKFEKAKKEIDFIKHWLAKFGGHAKANQTLKAFWQAVAQQKQTGFEKWQLDKFKKFGVPTKNLSPLADTADAPPGPATGGLTEADRKLVCNLSTADLRVQLAAVGTTPGFKRYMTKILDERQVAHRPQRPGGPSFRT